MYIPRPFFGSFLGNSLTILLAVGLSLASAADADAAPVVTPGTCVAGADCASYCAGFKGKDYLATACPLIYDGTSGTGGRSKAGFCAGRVCVNTSERRSDAEGCFCCCSVRAYLGPDPCPMEAGACGLACRRLGQQLVGLQCPGNGSEWNGACGGVACLVISDVAPPGCFCGCATT